LSSVEVLDNHKDLHNAAHALLPFFRNNFEQMACRNVVMDTTQTRLLSPSLRNVDGIDDKPIFGYIKNWKASGSFSIDSN
jgi:hypothetical protein